MDKADIDAAEAFLGSFHDFIEAWGKSTGRLMESVPDTLAREYNLPKGVVEYLVGRLAELPDHRTAAVYAIGIGVMLEKQYNRRVLN